MSRSERNSHDDLIKRIEQVETQMKSLVVSGVEVQAPTLLAAWKERIAELERRTDALALMSAKIAALETALERMATEYDTAGAVRLEAAERRLYALEQWRERKSDG